MKKPTTRPPRDLSTEARDLWRRIAEDYGIDDPHGCHLLATAMQAFDRMRQAQTLITEHGLCTSDRFGQLRANPAATIERDARAAMLSALKALNLDLEPLKGIGRPPGR